MQHLQVYHTDVKRLPFFSTLAPEVHSQEIGKKKNPLAPRGTSLMNLKERSREFIIVYITSLCGNILVGALLKLHVFVNLQRTIKSISNGSL